MATAELICGDALEVLRSMPTASVQCVVTSPPYFGLRDYGTGRWEGGDSTCDHKPRAASRATRPLGRLHGGTATVDAGTILKDHCHCGAVRVDGQIGLEPTIGEYVGRLVAVLREVRRVLADTGTLWLNLGDSYGGAAHTGRRDGGRPEKGRGWAEYDIARTSVSRGIASKQLLGIPWRVAFALQDDGWLLRSDIVWHKPNPMPESVRDRPTKSHEYLFLLARQARYWYDAEAVKETSSAAFHAADMQQKTGTKMADLFASGQSRIIGAPTRHENRARNDRNKRTVWTISTKPYKGAHFACFPPKLVEPCILAGCPAGGTVLDPFAGAATTGLVALQHGRHFIGIELNPAYIKLAQSRLAPLLAATA